MRTAVRFARIVALAVVLAAAVFALALPSAGYAAPSDQTISVTALKALLDASPDGTIPAYFKTVDRGSTIETIPATILAVTGGESADTALIMFEATGPQIDKFGGIVAGMSGSPLYVQDTDTNWKVAGAVSYGDYFTKGGTGLATPIGSMVAIRDAYAPVSVTLGTPVITTDGVVKKIVVSPTPQNFSAAAAQGTYVASPLSTTFIGGLNPSSTGYQLLAKDLSAHGHSVVSLAAPLGSAPAVGDQSFTTPLVPGAAVAALVSRGDMWLGGVGTVTYTDGSDLLAFGHPAYFTGPSDMYLSNAWIDGVWPDQEEPYKMARVGALRGTFTQDRGAGIYGSVGLIPDETTFTASVTDDDRSKTATSAVYMPRALVDSATIDPITAALSLYVAGERVEDAEYTPGSAEVTTTATATDGTNTYVITIPNVVDSDDVTLATEQDAATAISALQAIPTDGVHKASILSVDVKAHFTRNRRWGQIVGIALPHGLKAGASNEVDVLTRVYGQDATQTIPTTLTIPAGMATTGNLYATSRAYSLDNADWMYSEGVSFGTGEGITLYGYGRQSHSSLADVAKSLGEQLPNNVVTVDYYPMSMSDLSDSGDSDSPTKPGAESTCTTDWVLNNYDRVVSSALTVTAHPKTTFFGGFTDLVGELDGPSSTDTTVSVYATPYGGSAALVGTFKATEGDEGLEFDVPIDGPIYTNTVYTLHYDGDDTYAAAEASVTVFAKADVFLSAKSKSVSAGKSDKLTAGVMPAATVGGFVTFEYNDHGSHWKAIATTQLTSVSGHATATASYKVPKGKHKVRARYLGGASNAAGTSNSFVITGK